VPPSQLQLPDGVRSTDPVASPERELFEATVFLAAAGVAAVAGPECGCGACAICGCCIEASGRLMEANGLSLKRDVSALQAATPAAMSASTAARGKSRERNISATRDIAPHSYATRVPT